LAPFSIYNKTISIRKEATAAGAFRDILTGPKTREYMYKEPFPDVKDLGLSFMQIQSNVN